MALDVERVREMFAHRLQAWEQGDFDTYLSYWGDDVELVTPHSHVHGKAAYLERFQNSIGWSKPVSFVWHRIAIAPDDDAVLAEWTCTVERVDTGERISWTAMSSAYLRDDKIVYWREYYDPAQLAGLTRHPSAD